LESIETHSVGQQGQYDENRKGRDLTPGGIPAEKKFAGSVRGDASH
jgi:hypothetical protein